MSSRGGQLPHICHPDRVRVKRRRGLPFYQLILLSFLLWPGTLSIGSVEDERLALPQTALEQPVAISLIAKVGPQLPQIAIVIDDLGGHWQVMQDVINLDEALTVAILPHTRFALEGARLAHHQGRSVLLHLPLEPLPPRHGGHPWEYRELYQTKINRLGFLTTKMSRKDIAARLQEDASLLPFCVGLNNHMGSRFTQDRARMEMVLDFAAQHDLIFLDSLTSPKSLAYPLAKEKGLRAAARDIFLDHDARPQSIRKQFRQLRHLAREKGQSIAIGHPFPATLKMLKEELPRLRADGFAVVPIDDLDYSI